MKIQKLKFRGMSYLYQSFQFGLNTKNNFIYSPFAVLQGNTRQFTTFFRLLDVNYNVDFIENKSIVKYDNADTDKVQIFYDNQNKSGIYMWKNLTNGKCYIGSAVDLSNRLRFYFSATAMENYIKISKSHIYNAILKHGHSKFSLTILEYCEPSKCLEREGFYLKKIKPDYNIAKEPGAPMYGRKHSYETCTIISEANIGAKNPMYGKNHSDEIKQIISAVHKGKTLSDEAKTKIAEAKKIYNPGRFKTGENHPNYGKKVEGAGRLSQQIEVTDITNNTTTSYDSISEAARALNISQAIITKYFFRNQQKPYKGQYIFKKKVN